ncbi:DUF4105 domain-containing protein [Massilia dura]|uniref:DUF4105 domain-containing protein n=1 Tax=Pseudoduganella dura TaxID=321982 RepID=A0A6I3XVZ0_9BURK|nr:DUF4105 domain-containing protein [Pseudoduganella dura]MUI15905.1 DUF4105 domain-containing protein [Pseudoduganella dura]GGY15922.1 membrane protein [Pseudoduganella dura]
MRWPHGAATAARGAIKAVATLAAVLATAWGALALWYQLPRWPAAAAAGAWCVIGIAAAVAPWRKAGTAHGKGVALACAVAAMLMFAWWRSIVPSHERAWADDVARLLASEVDGDRVTLHNVRNFDWQSETRYTPRWETRQYDLGQLESADLILSYWMGPHIAHTLVSFGFADGRKLVFSLEIRKERHEAFSALGGFFRKFEEVLIAADEHDIVRTRSNARGEQVYLYRLRATHAQLRAVFLAYLRQAAQLHDEPTFYNTLTSNCTTVIFDLARQIAPGLPLDWRLLASGHFAEYAHDQGALTAGYTYAVLRQRGYINPRALKTDAGDAAGFSRAIRVGIPGVPAGETQPLGAGRASTSAGESRAPVTR